MQINFMVLHFSILSNLIRVYVLSLPNVSSCFEARLLDEQRLHDCVDAHAHARVHSHCYGYVHCHCHCYGYVYVYGDANFLPALLIFDQVDDYG